MKILVHMQLETFCGKLPGDAEIIQANYIWKILVSVYTFLESVYPNISDPQLVLIVDNN